MKRSYSGDSDAITTTDNNLENNEPVSNKLIKRTNFGTPVKINLETEDTHRSETVDPEETVSSENKFYNDETDFVCSNTSNGEANEILIKSEVGSPYQSMIEEDLVLYDETAKADDSDEYDIMLKDDETEESLQQRIDRTYEQNSPNKKGALNKSTSDKSNKLTNSGKKRRPNFSDEELIALAVAVTDRRHILLNRFNQTVTGKAKTSGWEEVSCAVNVVSDYMYSREPAEVRKKFSDFRAVVKKKAIEERELTGGTEPLKKSRFNVAEQAFLPLIDSIAIYDMPTLSDDYTALIEREKIENKRFIKMENDLLIKLTEQNERFQNNEEPPPTTGGKAKETNKSKKRKISDQVEESISVVLSNQEKQLEVLNNINTNLEHLVTAVNIMAEGLLKFATK